MLHFYLSLLPEFKLIDNICIIIIKYLVFTCRSHLKMARLVKRYAKRSTPRIYKFPLRSNLINSCSEHHHNHLRRRSH
jgi:hypothetical protein